MTAVAKPSEGQGGRTRATDPETRCPSLQRHGRDLGVVSTPPLFYGYLAMAQLLADVDFARVPHTARRGA